MDFGPPNPVKPAHELLAETLLAEGRFEEAKIHFELALKRAPGRRLSLEGHAQAPKSMESRSTNSATAAIQANRR
jgi:hypothetical protein